MADVFPQLQIMDANGQIKADTAQLRPADLTDEALKSAYEKMLFMRLADQKANNLQRTGRMGTYASIRGQEAIQTAAGLLLKRDDWLVPAFRELGVMWMHGIPIKNIYLYWMGNEIGNRPPENVECLPIAIPVGSQMLHAVGLGMGMKMRNEKNVAVTFFGDGATSEGDFHEAMNCAAVYKSNTVFVCQNNQWAISVPRSRQTASETIAQKAAAYGMPGIQVDGNDLLACYFAIEEAMERARTGQGPTLIEAYTYRLGDHTTSDDAKKYRDPAEVEEWKPRDPMLRLKKYLTAKNLYSEEWENSLTEKFQAEIEEIAIEAEQTPYEPSDIFNFTYAQLPENLEEQRDSATQQRAEY